LNDAVANEDDRAAIFEHAQVIAVSLVNHEQDATPTGGRPRAVRFKHRSEFIASCGVGARTLARALLFAERGDVEELASLVATVPDAVERPAFSARLLQGACLSGQVVVVEWLLAHGADVVRPWPLPVALIGGAFEGVFYVTPMCAARMKHRSDLATLLVDHGARDDVFTAAFLGDVGFINRLLMVRPELSQIPDPATDVLTITPVHHAVAGGQMPSLRLLLEHADQPVLSGGRALRAAAQRGNRVMIDLLLDHGADATRIGAGRWVTDAEIAPRLANAGASAGIGTDGQESGDWVRISCTGNKGRKDDPLFVAALLRYGASVETSYNGASPLHYAVKAGFVQTIRVLLDSGADRDALDERGQRPTDWLTQAGKSVDREVVQQVFRTR